MNEMINTEELEDRKEMVEACIKDGDSKKLNEIFSDMEAIDFAQIVEALEDEEIPKVMQLLNDENRTALMEESSDEMRIRLAKTLDNHALLDMFADMQRMIS